MKIINYNGPSSLNHIKQLIKISIGHNYLPEDWNQKRKNGDELVYTKTRMLSLKSDCIFILEGCLQFIFHIEQDSSEYWKDQFYDKIYTYRISSNVAFDRNRKLFNVKSTETVFCSSDRKYYILDEIDFIKENRIIYVENSDEWLFESDVVFAITEFGNAVMVNKAHAYMWRSGELKTFQEPSITISSSLTRLLYKCNHDSVIADVLLSAINNALLVKVNSPDYISYREAEGMISFMPYGKEQKFTEDESWVRNGRQSAKPAKVVKMILEQSFSDKELEQFANCFKAIENEEKIVIQESSFDEAYCSLNYCDRPDSCMWDKGYTEFYPDSAKAMVAVNGNGDFVGRAILWDAIIKETNENIKLLDRIYGKDDIKQFFKDWAKQNGFAYKQKQTYDSKREVVFNGNNVYMSLIVNAPNQDEVSYFPYMDTFTFGDGKILSNDTTLIQENKLRIYNHIDGECGYSEYYGCVRLSNGDWVDSDNAVEINGVMVHIRDTVFCLRLEQNILAVDAVEVPDGYVHRQFVNADGTLIEEQV